MAGKHHWCVCVCLCMCVCVCVCVCVCMRACAYAHDYGCVFLSVGLCFCDFCVKLNGCNYFNIKSNIPNCTIGLYIHVVMCDTYQCIEISSYLRCVTIRYSHTSVSKKFLVQFVQFNNEKTLFTSFLNVLACFQLFQCTNC